MDIEDKFGVVQMVGDEFWTVLGAGDGGPDSKLFYIVGKLRGENGHGFWIAPESLHDREGKDITTNTIKSGKIGTYFIRWNQPTMIAMFDAEPPELPIGTRPR